METVYSCSGLICDFISPELAEPTYFVAGLLSLLFLALTIAVIILGAYRSIREKKFKMANRYLLIWPILFVTTELLVRFVLCSCGPI